MKAFTSPTTMLMEFILVPFAIFFLLMIATSVISSLDLLNPYTCKFGNSLRERTISKMFSKAGWARIFLKDKIPEAAFEAIQFDCDTQKNFLNATFFGKTITPNSNNPDSIFYSSATNFFDDKTIYLNEVPIYYYEKELHFEERTGALISKPGRQIYDEPLTTTQDYQILYGEEYTPKQYIDSIALSMISCYQRFLEGTQDPLLYINVERPFTCEIYLENLDPEPDITYKDLINYMSVTEFKGKPMIDWIGGSFRACTTANPTDDFTCSIKNDNGGTLFGWTVANTLLPGVGTIAYAYYAHSGDEEINLGIPLCVPYPREDFQLNKPFRLEIDSEKFWERISFTRQTIEIECDDLGKLINKAFNQKIEKPKIGYYDDTSKTEIHLWGDITGKDFRTLSDLRTWDSCSNVDMIKKDVSFTAAELENLVTSRAVLIPRGAVENVGTKNLESIFPFDSVVIC